MALTEHQLAAIKADGVVEGRFEATFNFHGVEINATYYPDGDPEYTLFDKFANTQVFDNLDEAKLFIEGDAKPPTSLEKAIALSEMAEAWSSRAALTMRDRNLAIGEAMESGATANEVAEATGLSVPAIRKIVQQLRSEGAIGYLDNRSRKNQTEDESS